MTECNCRGPAARRAEALFGATGAGTLSLLVGCRGSLVASTISIMGGRLVIACQKSCTPPDHPHAGQRHQHVTIEACTQLPFADRSFDCVFAPYLSAVELRGTDRHRSHGELVREYARVLKPGGRLVLCLPNPALVAAVKLTSAGLRLAPRSSLRLKQRLRLHDAPRSPLPYSQRGLERVLIAGGFEKVAGFGIWPRLGEWDALIPEGEPRRRRRELRTDAARTPMIRAAALFGVGPGRFVVAQVAHNHSPPTDPAATPVLESIVEARPWDPSTISAPPLLAKGSRAVMTLNQGVFYKVALTPDATERQRAEIAANARLRSTHVGEFMVAVQRTGEFGHLSYASYPAVQPIGFADESQRIAAMARIFRLLGTDAVLRRAGTTRSWIRIFSGPARIALEKLGAGDLCRHMESTAASKKVLAGIVHNDLHPQNVMQLSGRPVLIDWEYPECEAPLILDRCNAVYQLLIRSLRSKFRDDRRLTALELMLSRDARVPLIEYIDEAAGEMDWREVIILHVLSTNSWRLIRGGELSPATLRAIARQLSFCRGVIP